MTEQKLFRRFLTSLVILAAAFLLLSFSADLIWGNDYMDTLPFASPSETSTFTMDGDGKIEVSEYRFTPDGLFLKATGTAKGSCWLVISDGEHEETFLLTVSDSGRIRNENNGNFSAFQVHLVLIIIAVAALSGILWFAFYCAVKYLRYSYQSIFYCGFAIWTSVATIILAVSYLSRMTAFTIYGTLQSSGWQFVLVTAPLLLLFCIALAISNIALIRHESFRFQNALGLLLTVVIIAGALICLRLNLSDFSGSELAFKITTFLGETYAAVFVLFECFLIGAVICGSIAAHHVPKQDVDFIIILGCGFRKDGTLYPLLQSRVDRAIDLYHRQIDRGGKHPIIVPSGGQGADEIMPEAEAMRNYILSKGIPESDVMIENKSRTTAENMRFSRSLIDEAKPDAKTAFSTTNYHVFRSGIISRQCGFAPEGIGSRTKWYFWPNAYVRECIGMISYMKKRLVVMILLLIALYAFFKFVLFA